MTHRMAWHDPAITGKHPDIGLIADEVAVVEPIAGAYDKDGALYNFRDRPVLALALKAIQEQQAEIEALKVEVAALRAKQ